MKKILFATSILITSLCANAQTPTLQWAKKLGEITYNQKGVSTGIDASGNVYSVGNFEYGIDLDPSASVSLVYAVSGSTDIYISKLDASGNFVWGKTIGGTGIEDVKDVVVDATGNTYITGKYEPGTDFDPSISATYTLPATDSHFILKLDPLGNFLWAKSFGDAFGVNSKSIAIDNTGNIYLTGYFSSLVDFDPSAVSTYTLYSYPYASTFILKLDNSGNFNWAKKIGEGGNDGCGNNVCTDLNGRIYVTGYFYGSADFDPSPSTYSLTANLFTRDSYITKFDGLGNLIWAKNLGGGYFDEGISCNVDTKGNVYSTGYYSGIGDFDPSSTSTYTLGGGTTENNIFVSKLDSVGNFVWANKIGGSYDDRGTSIITDGLNNVYIAGYFKYICDFNPLPIGTYTITSNGSQDGFITKLDENGVFVWNATFGAIAADWVNCLMTDPSNNVYATGFYERNTDFDPSSGIFNLPGNTGNTDAFVLKLTGLTTNLSNNKDNDFRFSLYPNPAHEFVNINLEQLSNNPSYIIITNILGEIISSNTFEDNTRITINTSHLNSGVYFVTLENSGAMSTQKIVIE